MATVVLGGGYAGIMAANRLAARGAPVRLVTTRPWFVERIRLHTVASGARTDARVPLEEVLDGRVEVEVGTAARIGHDAVELESGASVPFDTLVFAVGSGATGGSRAFRVTEEAQADRLRAELESRPDARVTVAGAGLTGIELAAYVARGTVELGRVDGRYLSTEVAGGFTGRTWGVRAVDGTVTVRRLAVGPLDKG
ncbi:MAG: FAD-dependent oxidoreductase [Actinomycetota bacterium]|nr:FAD-dependent oxidoreductase [Actinomycetota bacterium]